MPGSDATTLPGRPRAGIPALLFLAACAGPAAPPATDAAPAPPDPAWDTLKARPEVLEAWKDMRFGLFICWGPVTLTGQEIGWSRGAPPWGRRKGVRGGKGKTPAQDYDTLYKKWKPDRFDARDWVRVAQETGTRYIIFLVKHHDGFCLYDTKLTDYKSTGPDSAWKVDVMKAVADACHEAGIKLIVYYSQPDWHHPDYLGEHHDRYIQYLHGQVRELLTHYGRIDGLWFDNLRGRGNNPEAAALWDAERLFKMARELQPGLIINDRCGLDADYYTPEQHVGHFSRDRAWESCITLGTQWAWKPDDKLKSYTEAVRMLVVCAAGDGNLALNTNPMPDGRIEPRQVESFRKIGAWLKKHGESIYGTRGGPFVAPDMDKRKFNSARDRFRLPGGRWWGGSTHKGNAIYLHILRWPADAVALPPIPHRVVRHRVLTGGEATVTQTEEGLEVRVPAADRDPIDTIVKLELDGPAGEIPVRHPGITPSGSLAAGGKATASNYFRNQSEFAPKRAFDDDPETRWGCDWGTTSAWLEVDLGAPKTFSRAWISEPYDRVRAFALEVRRDGRWEAVHRGERIGGGRTIRFEPATARRVRLNLLKTTDGPSIWEFQLFAR